MSRTITDLETKLPRMIEEAVTARFQQMAGKLQQEIEETHVRTLESFVKNVQVKLVQPRGLPPLRPFWKQGYYAPQQ